jgi:replicative DNA helicase
MAIAENLTGSFVKELLSVAMDNNSVFDIVIQHMKYQYLQTDAEKNVWKALTKYYKKYKKCPTYGILSQQIADNIEAVQWLEDVECTKLSDNVDALLDNFQEYLRQMMFLDANERIVETFNRGNKEESYKLFTDMAAQMQQLSIYSGVFERVFGDFIDRHRRRVLNEGNLRFRIPTGILYLDDRMGGRNGGVESGEAALLLGASGSGKSQALIHLGLTASRLGYNVVHFQLEGTRDQCLQRYDAAWTGILTQEIRNGEIDEKRMKKLERIIKDKKRKDIYIQAKEEYGGMSILDVRKSCKELQRQIGEIHLIIVDYLELLVPGDGLNYSPDNERHRQTKIARGLKEIAMEFDAALWTATQSNDVARDMQNDNKFVLSRNNLSEDKGKIRPFDIFITLNQTDDEKKENRMRLWCDKLREHKNIPKTIHIVNNFDCSRFYDRIKSLALEEND